MRGWAACAVMAGVLGRCGVAQAPVVRRSPPRPAATQAGDGAEAPQGLGDEVPTIEVQSRLVEVPVTVVDRGGLPVGGLEKKDFAVTDEGKPQTIAVFEREAGSPLSVVLAIDASETVLTSARLEREAAKHFVRSLLRPQDELDLMDFADVVREIVSFTNDQGRIERGLGEVTRGDETALYDAVYLASGRLGEASRMTAGRRRVLVVISDGGDSKNKSTYAQAVEAAQRAGVAVFAIIVVPIAADAGRNTGGEHALIQMADDTGGRYYYVEDPKELDRAFAKVSDDLRTQYVLGYYAPGSGRDPGFRRIGVTLTRPELAGADTLRYRKGYFSSGR